MDIPRTSKAMVLTKFKEPLELMDIPVPELKQGDMLCKVRLASVCGTDVHLQRDELSMHPPTPIIMGHETVGEIYYLPDCVKTDVAGTPVKVGDRIMWSHLFDGTCYSCKVLHEPSYAKRAAATVSVTPTSSAAVMPSMRSSGRHRLRPHSRRRHRREAVGACCAGRTVVNAFDKLYNCGGIHRRRSRRHGRRAGRPVRRHGSPVRRVRSAVDISENRLEFQRSGVRPYRQPQGSSDRRAHQIHARPLRGAARKSLSVLRFSLRFAENFDILANPSKYLIIGQTSDNSVSIVPTNSSAIMPSSSAARAAISAITSSA